MTTFYPNSYATLTVTPGPITVGTGGISTSGHIVSTGAAPGMAAGGSAGGSPPAPVVSTGASDSAGSATFGTGTVPSAGAMVVVTFASSYGANTPGISLDPANAATGSLVPYISAASGTGFTVSVENAPAASQANTTYAFSYVVIG